MTQAAVAMQKPKRSFAPPATYMYALAIANGTPIVLIDPQQRPCSSAARSGRNLVLSTTVASIITSGIAKLMLIAARRRPYVKGEKARGSANVKSAVAITPTTPAKKMYGAR